MPLLDGARVVGTHNGLELALWSAGEGMVDLIFSEGCLDDINPLFDRMRPPGHRGPRGDEDI